MGTNRVGRSQAVFLDRDGVINRNVLNPTTGEYESPLTPDEFNFLPGALDAMCDLRAAGFLLFLVSNQPNYAKGKSTLATLNAIHGKFLFGLKQKSIEFARFYYCFHHPQGCVPGYSGWCACRKPSPYFLFRAESEFGVDLDSSWMIGDRSTDVMCGKAAGTRTVFIRTGKPHVNDVAADRVAPDLVMASVEILSANSLTQRREA
jgi:D-glycero-D-manno-heptose 1,7-bisphosphate phosphatase